MEDIKNDDLEEEAEQSRLRSMIACLSLQRDGWKAQIAEQAKIITARDQRISTDTTHSE